MVHLTPEERALCTALGNLMRKGRWTSRRIGSMLGLSEHTVRSLVCTRRRPGPTVLEHLEEGCVRLLLDAKTAGARQVWWHLLDATFRCGMFQTRDPVARLREMLRRDIEDGSAPEDFYDIRPEMWEAFDAGGFPTRELIETATRSYRREAEWLMAERDWKEALWYRGVALVAERILAPTN